MIRIGILTIKEKWEMMLGATCFDHTVEYLRSKFPLPSSNGSCLMINGGILPTTNIIKEIKALKQSEALFAGKTLVAVFTPEIPLNKFPSEREHYSLIKEVIENPLAISNPWDIFQMNGEAIERDFELLTRGKKSLPIPSSNRVIHPEKVFIEEGAIVECSVLNAQTGPIYIGKDAEVMEGSLIRGPVALCEHATLKMGAKIYGPTTIGPHSKVGGEVSNCVIFGYSNKGHDGFIGNTVIGEWCNLGADTNTSNLKNNYINVKLWNYVKKGFVDTGLQFCGLVMGDHSKCGINTMFNTGTVVGVSANIFGDGFPRNFIPSFSWGGAQGFSVYKTSKAFETAKMVMSRRGVELSQEDMDILNHIFDETAGYRH
jgi:UDP-N-acetylglucosamine diphosphorylase/glucosamine-1-phosphate N-acetyltransferase